MFTPPKKEEKKEGFYGPTTQEKFEINLGDWVQALGVDFMYNSAIKAIDFASIHVYPNSRCVFCEIIIMV